MPNDDFSVPLLHVRVCTYGTGKLYCILNLGPSHRQLHDIFTSDHWRSQFKYAGVGMLDIVKFRSSQKLLSGMPHFQMNQGPFV